MTPERAAAEEQAAREYAAAISGPFQGDPFWRSVNTDIVNRWSKTALMRIKRRAWQIVERGR